MAKKKWLVASQEGADYAHEEVGSVAELDLSHSEEKALVAAGWLEEPKQKTKEG